MFDLDFKSKAPIYEQLYKNIIKMAVLGLIKPNQQLMAIRTLAKELEINPNTVQKAYKTLEKDGVIYSIPGKGSFLSENINVSSGRQKDILDKLKNIFLEAYLMGINKKEIIKILEETFNERK